VRYPRDNVSERFVGQACPPFELGKAHLLTPEFSDLDERAPDVAVLAFGVVAHAAMDARDQLDDEVSVAVYDARFAKPVDRDLIRDLLSRRIPVVTIEDHSVVGGFGSAVVEAAAELRLNASRVTRLGLPDSWIHQDSRSSQLREAGLDATSVAAALRSAARAARPVSEIEARRAGDRAGARA
jgi:1-deoxy-D-xylulose-5-phosphate synthase